MQGKVRRAGRIAAVVVAFCLAAASAVGTGTAVAGRVESKPVALPTWHVAARLALGTGQAAVDCPDADACWALESGHLLSSVDGGQSWSDRTALVPDGVTALIDLDCTAPRQCAVAATDASGAALVVFLDDAVVTTRPVDAAPTAFTALSCTTALRCVGITRVASFGTADGGVTWSQGSLPRSLLGEPNIDCVPASPVCYAVGNYGLVPTLLRSDDRGRSWTLQTAPWDDGGVYGIDCASVSDCVATGASMADYALVVRTTDGGQHWNFASTPSHPYPLRSVSCVTVTRCTAVGQSPGNTTFAFATTNGQQWTEQPVPAIATDVPAAVACPTVAACTALTSAQGFATSDSGTSWQPIAVPAAVEAPRAMACATAMRCIAVGTDAAGRPFTLRTVNGGKTWTPTATPTGGGRPSAVDCPTAQACFALAVVDVAGTSRNKTQLWASTDGGRSWQIRNLRAVVLGGLSCPDPSTCLFSGHDRAYHNVLFRTTDAGTHLEAVATPSTDTVAGAVCGSLTSCVVLAGIYDGTWMAYTSTNLGASFTPHVIASQDWFGLDCSGSFCMAAGADSGSGAIATSTDGGIHWTDAVVPPQAQLISDVSCGSPTSCAASTYDFNFSHGGARIIGTRDAGASWQVFKVPARHEAPIAVACAHDRCIASDYSNAANPIIVAGPP